MHGVPAAFPRRGSDTSASPGGRTRDVRAALRGEAAGAGPVVEFPLAALGGQRVDLRVENFAPGSEARTVILLEPVITTIALGNGDAH